MIFPWLKIGLSLTVIAMIAGAGYRYRSAIVDVASLKLEVTRLEGTQKTLMKSLDAERVAAETARADRDAARQTLDEFRRERALDPEATAWGAVGIPAGERHRLCLALASLPGCPDPTPAEDPTP